MESTSKAGCIQLSASTAKELKISGKERWITPREDAVEAKGKGEMFTFWANPPDRNSLRYSTASSTEFNSEQMRAQMEESSSRFANSSLFESTPLRMLPESHSESHESSSQLTDHDEVMLVPQDRGILVPVETAPVSNHSREQSQLSRLFADEYSPREIDPQMEDVSSLEASAHQRIQAVPELAPVSSDGFYFF